MATIDPTPTTGLSTVAKIQILSTPPLLVLEGSGSVLTYQVNAQALDIHNNVQSGAQLYYSTTNPEVAVVSPSGLVHAVAPGSCNIQVSAAAFGNTIATRTANGLPLNLVYAEQLTTVQEGVPLYPDFSFTLSTSTLTMGLTDTQSITITQTVAQGLTNPVTYSFYTDLGGTVKYNGYQTSFLAGTATITGNGTATLTLKTYASLPGTFSGQVLGFAGSQMYGMPPTSPGYLTHLQPLAVTVA